MSSTRVWTDDPRGIYTDVDVVNPAGIGTQDNPLTHVAAQQLVLKGYTTVERDALTDVKSGTVVLNTTTNKLNVYLGTGWQVITSA